MANLFNQVLKAGLQANYDALPTKDPNVLYFCTDSKKIYKGTIDFTESCIAADSKPLTPIAGKLYFLADTNTVEAYINGAWTVVSRPLATTVDSTSDDVHVVSAKAVYDAIQNLSSSITASTDIVKSIKATDGTPASITYEKGDGSTTNFLVKGVVTKPTWDSTARKLTIPVTGDTAVEVEFGKDIFVDPSADNKYNPTTGNIELYLNDGNGSTGTKIEIPASSLVSTYTGEATTSATATVVDNKISVAVKVDPDSGNALVVGENGLKVDLSAYSTTVQMEAAIKVAKDAADAAQATADANATTLTTLQGSGDGSISKAVSDAVAAAKNATDSDIAAIQGTVTGIETRVSTAESEITGIKSRLDTVEADLVNAAAATAWGSF